MKRKLKMIVDIVMSIFGGFTCFVCVFMVLCYIILGWNSFMHHAPFGIILETIAAGILFILFAIVSLVILVCFYADYKEIKKK